MIDLEKIELDVDCSICGFYNKFSIREAKLQEVIICRGCKANIFLKDYLAEVKLKTTRVQNALDDLMNKVTKQLEIKIQL